MKIKAAIFDMDGTLVDSLMCWDVLWQEYGDRYLDGKPFAPTDEDEKAIRTLPLKNAMDLIHNNYGLGCSGDELLALANEFFKRFYATGVKLKEGTREFLDFLYDNGVKMCIASATAPELLNIAIEHCEIGKYFEKIFSCSNLGVGKDKPDIYLLAQNYFGTKTAETFVFEDSFVAIETASKIGMPTVAIFDKYNPYQDKIKSLATIYVAEGESIKQVISSHSI